MAVSFPVSDFRIAVITSPHEVPGEINMLKALLRAGVDHIHIRRPGWSHERLKDFISQIPADSGGRYTLHHNPQLAISTGCLTHPGHSRSCHSLEELSSPAQDLNYQFLSPIFDSISKKGYTSTFNINDAAGAQRLHESLAQASVPVYALGGVTIDKFPLLSRLGFAGAALLGYVWENHDGYLELLRYLRLRNGRLQFITDASTPEATAQQALEAIDGGCRWIQVRMKGCSSEMIARAVDLIHASAPSSHPFTLIVDDHTELLAHPGVDGVHLGQEDMPPADARTLTDNSKIIGLTVNRPDQLLGSIYAGTDYYGIGPFRFTGTKKRLAPTLGPEGYRTILKAMSDIGDNRPFVAIGGITPADIPSLLASGIPGIAVAGAIAHSPEPQKTTADILKLFINHNT